MNSLQELNGWGNTAVTYTDQANYLIAFGTNAGNTSLTVSEDAAPFTLPKQVDITTLQSPIADVLIIYTANNSSAISSIEYTGSEPVYVSKDSPTKWTVRGIRSISAYNDGFTNTRLKLVPDGTQSFSLSTTVNDQYGNTRSWNTSVTISQHNEYSIPSSITFDEDIATPIQPISITDLAANTTTYAVTVAMNNPIQGQIRYSNTDANSQVITGTKSQINATFAANQVIFVPAPDRAANTTVTYTQVRIEPTGNIVQANAVPITMAIGNTHPEFNIPSSITFDEDIATPIQPISITDLAANTTTYAVTVAMSDGTQGQIRFGSSNANSQVITGTKSQINDTFAANQVIFVPTPDRAANTTVTYTQVRIEPTGNIVQANSLPITMAIGNTHPEFSSPSSFATTEDEEFNLLGFSITDTNPTLPNYQVVFTAPRTGDLIVYGNTAASSQTITGSRSTINSILSTPGAIKFRPQIDFSGSTSVQYAQTQTTNSINQGSVVVPILVRDRYDFYFNDTVFLPSSSALPDYNMLDTISGRSYSGNFFCSNGLVTFTLGGTTQGNLTVTGNSTQMKTQIDTITVNNTALTSSTANVVVYSQTNTTDSVSQGQQRFWRDPYAGPSPGLRFASFFSDPGLNQRFGVCVGSDLSWPERTPWRVFGDADTVYQLVVSQSVQQQNLQSILFYWPGSLAAETTATFVGTPAQINENLHWKRFQAQGAGNFTVVLRNNATQQILLNAAGTFNAAANSTQLARVIYYYAD